MYNVELETALGPIFSLISVSILAASDDMDRPTMSPVLCKKFPRSFSVSYAGVLAWGWFFIIANEIGRYSFASIAACNSREKWSLLPWVEISVDADVISPSPLKMVSMDGFMSCS